MHSHKVSLKGSERKPLGTRVGAQSDDEVIEISIILKPKSRAPISRSGGAAVSREEFAAHHGADNAAVELVRQLAAEYHISVSEISYRRRTVKVKGTAGNMSKAFEVVLAEYVHEGRHYRGRTGAIQIPAELAEQVEAVLGLDNRPQAKPHFRRHSGETAGAAKPISYSPRQVAQLYDFPLDVDGTGQTIGIVELGGGYQPADLANYFQSLGIAQPKVISVSVDGGQNAPTTPDSADGEVLLDIEVAGAVAPGAKIVVYFCPNTTAGFQDALTTAVHDLDNKPSVISISWGGPEDTWTAQSMQAFESAAQDAAALGVTICAASGDNGSSDGETDGADHVDFPASSPHILGCGGTNLQSADGKITGETVWNEGSASAGAGGGGYSTQFIPVPAYQTGVVRPPAGLGRGVPDVCGDADPQTGYNVLVDGETSVIGGTSAVAPLWSGLIALLNQKLGRPVGFLQPILYALPAASGAFHDIMEGNNGTYSAGPGWDAASGLGSPSGNNLLKALAAPPAGIS